MPRADLFLESSEPPGLQSCGGSCEAAVEDGNAAEFLDGETLMRYELLAPCAVRGETERP